MSRYKVFIVIFLSIACTILYLFYEDLKLENNDSIEDIFMSDVWIDFHKSLIDDPDNAPYVCKKNCSKPFKPIISDEKF